MNKDYAIVPAGVAFKFIVSPSLSKYHQEGLRHFILTKSGLGQYFRNIDVSFFDGCFVDTNGRTITDDNLAGKQMQVKVFCPEPIIAVYDRQEQCFYEQIKEKFSEWIIDLIKSNTQTKYTAKLEAFEYVQRL